ncbi:hypothetical protein MHYP_G00089580 [Metynnis hypsauchen]
MFGSVRKLVSLFETRKQPRPLPLPPSCSSPSLSSSLPASHSSQSSTPSPNPSSNIPQAPPTLTSSSPVLKAGPASEPRPPPASGAAPSTWSRPPCTPPIPRSLLGRERGSDGGRKEVVLRGNGAGRRVPPARLRDSWPIGRVDCFEENFLSSVATANKEPAGCGRCPPAFDRGRLRLERFTSRPASYPSVTPDWACIASTIRSSSAPKSASTSRPKSTSTTEPTTSSITGTKSSAMGPKYASTTAPTTSSTIRPKSICTTGPTFSSIPGLKNTTTTAPTTSYLTAPKFSSMTEPTTSSITKPTSTSTTGTKCSSTPIPTTGSTSAAKFTSVTRRPTDVLDTTAGSGCSGSKLSSTIGAEHLTDIISTSEPSSISSAGCSTGYSAGCTASSTRGTASGSCTVVAAGKSMNRTNASCAIGFAPHQPIQGQYVGSPGNVPQRCSPNKLSEVLLSSGYPEKHILSGVCCGSVPAGGPLLVSRANKSLSEGRSRMPQRPEQLRSASRSTDASISPNNSKGQGKGAWLKQGLRPSDAAFFSLLLFLRSGSSGSMIAIDNKIEQAMDLVKAHLMLAVREEVEVLREQIKELSERNAQLERENYILRALKDPH